MKRLNFLLWLVALQVILFIVSGCSTSTPEKNAAKEKEMLASLSKESNDFCNKEEYKKFFIKSPCYANDITAEQLSDKSMIQESEKNDFLKYREEISSIDKKFSDIAQTYGDAKDKEFGKFLEKYSIVNKRKASLEFAEGKISWGEFNKSRKDIAQEGEKERIRIYGSGK
ncbi:MAG TPA: hypothetical protein VMU29_00040 [Smithella sp.]|nr:hypothetical protein [Smithella sp.]